MIQKFLHYIIVIWCCCCCNIGKSSSSSSSSLIRMNTMDSNELRDRVHAYKSDCLADDYECHALVIGNSKYTIGERLTIGYKNAEQYVHVLRSCGFEVDEVYNTNYSKLNQAIFKFIQKTRTRHRSRSLLYYAGHAFNVMGQIFLLPVEFNDTNINIWELNHYATPLQAIWTGFINSDNQYDDIVDKHSSSSSSSSKLSPPPSSTSISLYIESHDVIPYALLHEFVSEPLMDIPRAVLPSNIEIGICTSALSTTTSSTSPTNINYDNGGAHRFRPCIMNHDRMISREINQQFHHASRFYFGGDQQIERDLSEAYDTMISVATLGDADAQYYVSIMLLWGHGVDIKVTEAMKWLKSASAQQHMRASSKLGYIYHRRQNYKNAFKYYMIAANLGDPSSMHNLGLLYANGEGVEGSSVEALKWLRRSAEASFAQGLFQLGQLHILGRGVERHYPEAVYLLKRASELGHTQSQYNLGYMYALGAGTPQNGRKALYWFKRAVRSGDSESAFVIGNLYMQGTGVKTNRTRAMYWYKRAIDLGCMRANVAMGLAYAVGQGVLQDVEESIKHLTIAADAGDVHAQLGLGMVYYDGIRTPPQYDKAAKYFRKAAEQGYLYGEFQLANMYRQGQYVDQDYKQAADWYRKAADQGEVRSQFTLGLFYSVGQGVKRNPNEATNWYRRAAAAGDANAQLLLKQFQGQPINGNLHQR